MRKLDLFTEKNDTRLITSPDSPILQTFTPNKPNLAGVRLYVSNPKLGGQGQYLVAILDEKGQILRQETYSESNLGWEYQLRYDFLPIENSQGRNFAVSVSYFTPQGTDREKESSAGAGFVEKNYLGIACSNTDVYPEGSAYRGNNKLSGDLVFQTYYQVTPIGYLKDSFLGLSKKIGNDPFFFIPYFILLIILLYLLFRPKKN